MPNLENAAWEAIYPDGWSAEHADDSVVLYDNEAEVGTVQVSCICADQPVTREDLLDLAAELIDEGKRHTDVEIGGKQGIMFRYYDGDQSWKEWFLAAGECAFYVTYDCPREGEGVEDEEVAQILESLAVTGQ